MCRYDRVSLLNKDYADKVDTILRDYEKILGDAGREIFFISLIGSQNYELATNLSDYDAVAVIFPTYKEICLNKQIDCHELVVNNGKIKTVDIRNFITSFFKGNFTYFEPILSSTIRVNPLYKEFYEQLKSKVNQVFFQNYSVLYRQVMGMITSCSHCKQKWYRVFYHINWLFAIFDGVSISEMYTNFSGFSSRMILEYKYNAEEYEAVTSSNLNSLIDIVKEGWSPEKFYEIPTTKLFKDDKTYTLETDKKWSEKNALGLLQQIFLEYFDTITVEVAIRLAEMKEKGALK